MTPPRRRSNNDRPSSSGSSARGGQRGRKASPNKGAPRRSGNAPGRAGLPSARTHRKRSSAAPRLQKQHRTTRASYREEDFEPQEHPSHVPSGERLQKVMSAAGVASRRASEDLINSGRVIVDGIVVRMQGLRIDVSTAVVHVDGERVQLDTSRVYFALNKPVGVVSTLSDPEGRPCLGDIVGNREDHLFHVGRLDAETEGLIVLTNDGDLANRLQHPTYEVSKTYLVEVQGPVKKGLGKQLREGIQLEDGFIKVSSFKLVDSRPGRSLIEVVIHEGRNHIVRRMLEAVGYPVTQLVRTHVGPIALGNVKPGRMRPLTRGELASLMKAAGL